MKKLEEKKFKAQAMATPKGAKPPSPTKAQIDVKIAQAARNRSQQEVEKVERAAQETMKLAQARERRAMMDTHAREVAAISLNTKEVDCERRLMELDLEKEKKRMVDNTKREKVYERLAEDRERRAALLDEKLERATELKGQHDDLTRLRAAATSTCRVAAAQTRRDVDDAERRLHAAAELSTKMEESSRRREIETLDKVVRAASLGSAAVATAARRRAGLDNREKAIGARQLEIKLTGAELERRRKLEDVRNKAASLGTARVEAAAQERKYRQAIELMEGEHTRNANKLATDRAFNATMLKSGKASMANAAKMQVREDKATSEVQAVNEAKARLDAKLGEAEQREEQPHLLVVVGVEQLQRPQVVPLRPHELAAVAVVLADVAKAAAHATPRLIDPPRVQPARGPLAVRPGLLLHRLEQQVDQAAEVEGAQPLVAVGEHGQPDEGLRVRELGGVRRHILADEWHGEQPPRLRARVAAARLGRAARVVQQAVVHACHLGGARAAG